MDYRDTDTLYAVNDVVGEVKNAKIDQDKLELTGQVEPLSMEKYGLDHILLVEADHRLTVRTEPRKDRSPSSMRGPGAFLTNIPPRPYRNTKQSSLSLSRIRPI